MPRDAKATKPTDFRFGFQIFDCLIRAAERRLSFSRTPWRASVGAHLADPRDRPPTLELTISFLREILGAGKTTTLKVLLNLLQPTSGRASVFGVDSIALTKDHFRRIGYVTEDQLYPEWMTVRQLLAYYRPFYPLWEAKLMKRLQEIFVLPPDQPLRKLSRGMRVKAILLTVLAFHPELLLLDEPFGGLDPQVRDDFIKVMLEVHTSRREGSAAVFPHP